MIYSMRRNTLCYCALRSSQVNPDSFNLHTGLLSTLWYWAFNYFPVWHNDAVQEGGVHSIALRALIASPVVMGNRN